MSRHTCHIEILDEKVSYPSPDDTGAMLEASKGDTVLIDRADAERMLKADNDRDRDGKPAFRILTEAESAELDASA